ncbi:MAG: hypothetical protein K0S45_3120, partial [Nitrospira sp.]|nr:hypothetical protein [Nitrospira sp.]
MLFPLCCNHLLSTIGGIFLLILGALPLSGCHANPSTVTIRVVSGLPAAVSFPSGVRRFAIAHPTEAPQELLPAYALLETESRRLTEIPPFPPRASSGGRNAPCVRQTDCWPMTLLDETEER